MTDGIREETRKHAAWDHHTPDLAVAALPEVEPPRTGKGVAVHAAERQVAIPGEVQPCAATSANVWGPSGTLVARTVTV